MQIILLFCALFFTASLHGQSPQSRGLPKKLVIYQSPANGETYVPIKTTIILRLSKDIIRSRSAQDFSFRVLGEQSGAHSGAVRISDDNETLIFKPVQPFTINEKVTVSFRILSDESIPPFSYHFQISPYSDEEQNRRIKLFAETDHAGDISLDNKQVTGSSSSVFSPFQVDSIPLWKISIDSMVLQKVDQGNIFLIPGSPAMYLEMLDSSCTSLFERKVFQGRDFRPWPNNMISYFTYNPSQTILLNKDFTPIDSFICGNGYQPDFHDFRLLPNGHVLLLGDYTFDTNMRAVTGDSSASKNSLILGAVIQELDKDKNVIFQWRTGDYLSILDGTNIKFTDPNTTAIDCAHLNSIDVDSDGNIIASLRSMDQIIKIDRTTLKVIWRFGGKSNSFTFLGDTLRFSHQHDARRIANGHITMMDNGNYRKTKWGDGSYHDTSYSRAVEYALDETNFTAQAVWQYRDMPFSDDGGNVQRLPNGNTFIGLGRLNSPNAIEVSPSGEKVFQLSLQHGGYNYRSYKFQFPFSQNAVTPRSTEKFLGIGNIYPNPVSGVATVSFSLMNFGNVEVRIVDLLGHTVRSMNQHVLSAGDYSLNLDTSDMPNGTYFLRVSQNGNTDSKIFIVQK